MTDEKKYEYKAYNEVMVSLSEGLYTLSDLKAIVEHLEKLNKLAEEQAQETPREP